MKKLIIGIMCIAALVGCAKQDEQTNTTTTATGTETVQTTAGTTAATTTVSTTTASTVQKIEPTRNALEDMATVFMNIYDVYANDLTRQMKYDANNQQFVDTLMYYLCHYDKYLVNPEDYSNTKVKASTLDTLTSACFAGKTKYRNTPASSTYFTYNASDNTYTLQRGDRGEGPTPKIRGWERENNGNVKVTVEFVGDTFSMPKIWYYYLTENQYNTTGEFPWAVTAVETE